MLMMKVIPILGEPLRFRVQSEANPRKFYLVELEANHLAGQCDCHHWRIRIGPLIQHDFQTKVKRFCKHILAARSYFCERMLERIAAETKRFTDAKRLG